MELKSTTSFKDIDIDAMLEHTTFEEFMRGLYMNKVAQKPSQKGQQPELTDFEKMWQSVMDDGDDQKQDLKLDFGTEKKEVDKFSDDLIHNQALANVRERKKLLKQSRIFDGSEKKKRGQESQREKDLDNQVDLTALQTEEQTE